MALMAYLIVIAEHALAAPIESKISVSTHLTSSYHQLRVEQQAPVPGGRSVNACRKIIKKLKEKLNDDIENIKAGRPVAGLPAESEVTVKGTPRKRKAETGGKAGTSPKKKAAPRKKKSEAVIKDGDDEE
ncbi:hypothetical protein SVAN01_01979 [Stagonosporopsis vannaccii]|nr:hypothetical protein SVAN01_01979 [Stagonosporopsis vannaccii]